jgi:hypothetical protein
MGCQACWSLRTVVSETRSRATCAPGSASVRSSLATDRSSFARERRTDGSARPHSDFRSRPGRNSDCRLCAHSCDPSHPGRAPSNRPADPTRAPWPEWPCSSPAVQGSRSPRGGTARHPRREAAPSACQTFACVDCRVLSRRRSYLQIAPPNQAGPRRTSRCSPFHPFASECPMVCHALSGPSSSKTTRAADPISRRRRTCAELPTPLRSGQEDDWRQSSWNR